MLSNMPQKAPRKTKTKQKTKISVRGRLSVYFDPSTLRTHTEKTLHFIGVGQLKDTEELRDIRKPGDANLRVLNSKRPKSGCLQNSFYNPLLIPWLPGPIDRSWQSWKSIVWFHVGGRLRLFLHIVSGTQSIKTKRRWKPWAKRLKHTIWLLWSQATE